MEQIPFMAYVLSRVHTLIVRTIQNADGHTFTMVFRLSLMLIQATLRL